MSPSEASRRNVGPALAGVAAAALLVWLAGRVADLLLLLFIAILLAVYLGATTDFLAARTRIPRGAAFAAALLGTIAAVVGIGSLIIGPVVAQTQDLIRVLPQYVPAWESQLEALIGRIPGANGWVRPGEHQLVQLALEEVKAFAGEVVPRVFSVLHGFINLVSIMVMALYLALRPDTYRDLFITLIPPRHREAARDVITEATVALRAWTFAQLLAMLVLGSLTAVGLWLLDVPYWLTFGIFTGVVALVPFFGTLVSSLLPALFVLADGDGMRALLVVALGFVIHFVENNLVNPLIMQKHASLPPVLTIMSVLICGKLLGPMGLLVAVPGLSVLLVVVRKLLVERGYGAVVTSDTTAG
ncbi:MAG: AI-2E family transporter [Gemmatimonadetes bacterium]|nr:AI-2E family transporter [Gemmatimonadota bacterium]